MRDGLRLSGRDAVCKDPRRPARNIYQETDVKMRNADRWRNMATSPCLRRIEFVCSGYRTATLELVAETGEDLLQCGEEDQNVRFTARVTHQADAPYLALEGAEAGANFDIKLIQQLLSHGRIVDARRNPHRVKLRQRVPR